MGGEPSNDACPGEEILLRHGLKHLHCSIQVATFAVHVNEGSAKEDSHGGTGRFKVSVYPAALLDGAEVSAGGKDANECGRHGKEPGALHLGEERERPGIIPLLVVTGDQGCPGYGVFQCNWHIVEQVLGGGGVAGVEVTGDESVEGDGVGRGNKGEKEKGRGKVPVERVEVDEGIADVDVGGEAKVNRVGVGGGAVGPGCWGGESCRRGGEEEGEGVGVEGEGGAEKVTVQEDGGRVGGGASGSAVSADERVEEEDDGRGRWDELAGDDEVGVSLFDLRRGGAAPQKRLHPGRVHRRRSACIQEEREIERDSFQ